MESNAATGTPAWDRPVFVITTGRSGSTLLLRYLNCAHDLVVWGEHAAILTELSACYGKLTRQSTLEFVEAARPWVDSLLHKCPVVSPSEQMTIEWVNSFTTASVRDAFRGFLFALLNQKISPDVRWGFKEIHYGRTEMNLLRTLFPACRFLLLVREPSSVIRSKFTWFAMRDPARMLLHFDETLRFFQFAREEMDRRNPDTLLVRYEDLAATPVAEMRRIAAFVDTAMLEEPLQAIATERESAAGDLPDAEAALAAVLQKIELNVDPSQIARMAFLYRSLAADRAAEQPMSTMHPAGNVCAAA